MGKSQRTKGANYERAVATLFRDKMPGADVKRGLQYQHAQGATVPDVDCPIFWVECKRGKAPVIRRALHQAERDSTGTHKIPLAVVRDDGDTEAYATMRLDDLLEMVGELWELRTR